ncbi:stalk domain-containing protein [Paenibacillus sp. GCM10012303]|uniref:stalk domain-containing protein n=1 Tax=Paenibacillus sp. GCM10012303 TaxID=3317340 RepID=UPI0036129FE1
MKKVVILCITYFYLLFSLSTLVHAENQAPHVFLDGKLLEFNVSPVIDNGSTLVPLRKLFEEYGATVSWDETTSKVTAKYGETTLIYTIGDLQGFKDNKAIALEVPGRIIDGSTLIPVRFASEALGALVGWENKTRTITISTKSKRSGTVQSVSGNAIEILPVGEEKPTAEKVHLIGVEPSQLACTNDKLEGKTVNFEHEPAVADNNSVYGYLYLEDGNMLNTQMISEGCEDKSTSSAKYRWAELFEFIKETMNK